TVDQFDIDRFTSLDCNRNGIPDECDVAGHDCNTNHIPDDCETDCNTNGRADVCDIAVGASPDCDHDNIPDECELTSRVLATASFGGQDVVQDFLTGDLIVVSPWFLGRVPHSGSVSLIWLDPDREDATAIAQDPVTGQFLLCNGPDHGAPDGLV